MIFRWEGTNNHAKQALYVHSPLANLAHEDDAQNSRRDRAWRAPATLGRLPLAQRPYQSTLTPENRTATTLQRYRAPIRRRTQAAVLCGAAGQRVGAGSCVAGTVGEPGTRRDGSGPGPESGHRSRRGTGGTRCRVEVEVVVVVGVG
jgi:hypothetical protein